MFEIEDGDLLIIRFSPMNAQRLADQAQDSYDEREEEGLDPDYSISTFGDVKVAAESVEQLIVRVQETAPVGGARIWLARASELADAGFETRLSEPPPHHYDVVLGRELRPERVERLVEMLTPGRRRNPGWKK